MPVELEVSSEDSFYQGKLRASSRTVKQITVSSWCLAEFLDCHGVLEEEKGTELLLMLLIQMGGERCGWGRGIQ